MNYASFLGRGKVQKRSTETFGGGCRSVYHCEKLSPFSVFYVPPYLVMSHSEYSDVFHLKDQ